MRCFLHVFRKFNLVVRLCIGRLQLIALVLIISVILCNECLVYWIQSYRWISLPVSSTRDPNKEIVVLFVADPQILGNNANLIFPVGTIATWDVDRYIRITFSLAYRYAQPDVVIFLGDLMDEGSTAFPDEYASFLFRFSNIFHIGSHTKVIYLAGDSDVGGEGVDIYTQAKASRNEEYFGKITGIEKIHFVDFLKMNMFDQHNSTVDYAQVRHHLTAPVRVLINHRPMLSKRMPSAYPILREFMLNLIFSGHWHELLHFTCNKCLINDDSSDYFKHHVQQLPTQDSWMFVNLSDLWTINEIIMPTCNYRMGTLDTGYGLAVIKKSGTVLFTSLWLPCRFKQLYASLISVGVISVIMVVLYMLPLFK